MGVIPKKMLVTSILEKKLIFQNLMKLKEPLNIIINGIEYRGFIEEYDDDSITVRMDSPFIGDMDGQINTNFIFHNNYHYFTSTAQQIDEGRLQLIIPDKINKNMVRKYERVYVFGKVFLKMKIMIRSEKPELEASSLIDERNIYKEIKKPQPAIDKILKGIKQLVSEYAQHFQLKVFKPGQPLSFEEQLLKDTKKIFLINNSYEDKLTERRYTEAEIFTVSGAFAYLISQGIPRKKVEGKLLDLLQQKRDNRVFSECLIPLLLGGEVVGYIRLINDVDYHRSIKQPFAIRTSSYGSVLVEALAKYNYFRIENGQDFSIPVVDISAGGLLFKIESLRIKQYIVVNTVLQMSIKFPVRQIEARGIVYRIDKNASEYGVKFQEINEEDIKYIEGLVKREIPL
jgi:hypothetical protein